MAIPKLASAGCTKYHVTSHLYGSRSSMESVKVRLRRLRGIREDVCLQLRCHSFRLLEVWQERVPIPTRRAQLLSWVEHTSQARPDRGRTHLFPRVVLPLRRPIPHDEVESTRPSKHLPSGLWEDCIVEIDLRCSDEPPVKCRVAQSSGKEL